MPWLISVLGAIMGLAGAYSLWNGLSFIRLDWGQTETVAGTIALSGGIVTVGIGAVLFALRDLRVVPSAARATGPDRAADAPVEWDAAPISPGADSSGSPAPSRSRQAVSRVTSRLATVGIPRAEPVPPAAVPSPVEDEPPIRSAPPAAPDERKALRPDPSPRAEVRAEPSIVEAPTVVGRYDANGATYVLFSDGTIEVETESGTHRFASMADLKDHIERQDDA